MRNGRPVDRGLDTTRGVLVVLKEAEALRKAVRDVLSGRTDAGVEARQAQGIS